MVGGKDRGHGFFYRNTRLNEPPAPELEKLNPEDKILNFQAIHSFDKAHLTMLAEEGIIPRNDASKIASLLLKMEKEGVEKVRHEVGGGLHSGEAYAIKELGEEIGGKLHVGRSTGDLLAVTHKISQREKLLETMGKLISFEEMALEKAEEHLDTVMPGYSHMQHAQPVTFGHYLLSWLFMLQRDFDRLHAAYLRTNLSPAGAGIMSGSDFPLNRERTAELLGFDGLAINTRDAIFGHDHFLEAFSALAILCSTLGRLASDLFVFHTYEYGMVEIADRYCGTSSIMPQKKNPDGLEFIVGLSSVAIGRMADAFIIEKGVSDGPIWDRNFTVEDLFRMLSDVSAGLDLFTGILSTMKVNKERMKKLAGANWAQASDLAGLMVREKGLAWRTAHQIMAILVRSAKERGLEPSDVNSELLDKAAGQYIGKPLRLDAAKVEAVLDPFNNVQARTLIGGPSVSSARKQVDEVKRTLAEHRTIFNGARKKLEDASSKLSGAAVLLAKGEITAVP